MKVDIETGVYKCGDHWHGYAQIFFDGVKTDRCHTSPKIFDPIAAYLQAKVVTKIVREEMQARFGDDVHIKWVSAEALN